MTRFCLPKRFFDNGSQKWKPFQFSPRGGSKGPFCHWLAEFLSKRMPDLRPSHDLYGCVTSLTTMSAYARRWEWPHSP
jgi:hypothetical protein